MSKVTEKAVHDMAMDMLRDRETVLRRILESFEQSAKLDVGITKVLENFDEYMESPENLKKQLKTALKVNSQLVRSSMQMLSILMVYVTSNDFRAGAATLAARTGDPQEALQEMLRTKLGDR